jgi:hypothetical protein
MPERSDRHQRRLREGGRERLRPPRAFGDEPTDQVQLLVAMPPHGSGAWRVIDPLELPGTTVRHPV